MERQEIINQLHSYYAEKRRRAQFFAEQNKQKALENKEYFKLELKERELILDSSKLAFQNQDVTKLNNELQQVNKQKIALLKEIGLTKESLLPQYECKICNDTGKVKNEACICYKQAFNHLLMKESQIDLTLVPSLKDYKTNIFEKEQQEKIGKILDISNKFVQNFPDNKIQTIIFSGATGVGKTYLSKTIAKEIIAKGHTVYYTTSFQLNNLTLKYHTTFTESKKELLSPLLDNELLIIDDLGTEPILKNVTKEYLLLILTERIETNKSTIINTNLGPEHILDRYGERIFSRLMNKQNTLLIHMDGVDLRLKK